VRRELHNSVPPATIVKEADVERFTITRRQVTKILLAAPALLSKLGCALNPQPGAPTGPPKKYTAVVIGTGFGGTMTGLTLGRAFKKRGKGETVHMLERGTWWTTPMETVQDKKLATYDFLKERNQPVQFWPAADHIRGFFDIFLRCMRRKGNEVGLYDFTTFGKEGTKNDGVTVARASGVGGGSLIYSNVTIRPPAFVFDDPRWPAGWKAAADGYYQKARHAIGIGVLNLRDQQDNQQPPTRGLNAGLSNIVTRSARLDPHWAARPDPEEPGNPARKLYSLNTDHAHFDPQDRLWIDRARVFQKGISQITPNFGTVDSSINDLPTGDQPYSPALQDRPYNYCERQGRCIVGCLPGARHTLNKQLLAAIHGRVNDSGPHGPADLNADPASPIVTLEPLSEVDVISEHAGGGYEVTYTVYGPAFLGIRKKARKRILADSVIVAAGCVGTTEILLKSQKAPGDEQGLPHLSPALGHQFSTNGDYLGFLENTDERVSLTRGPITTSFGHFQHPEGHPGADPSKFHTIEDNGVPRPLSALTGFGVPILQSLVGGDLNRGLPFMLAAFADLQQRIDNMQQAFKKGQSGWSGRDDDRVIKSDDEVTARMMCIAAMGRDAARGKFTLDSDDRGGTRLRLARTDGRRFHEDPIYAEIRASLDKFARTLTSAPGAKFLNPFFDFGKTPTVGVSHPLGGCPMADSPQNGVVDEFGRVYRVAAPGRVEFYPRLYVADGSVIPTALGVNPSLTIAAVSLRIADKIVEEL
jgi:choline dehydrogenase-like flavoprotein